MNRPTFERRVRGYDPVAVDAWVAEVSAVVAMLRRDLEASQAKVAEHEGAQSALVRTLTSAHLMAERLVEETEEEAARRRDSATTHAELVLADARREAHEVVLSARLQARRELAELDLERTVVRKELDELRALLRDERLRARQGLAEALAAVERKLGDDPFEPTFAERTDRSEQDRPATRTLAVLA